MLLGIVVEPGDTIDDACGFNLCHNDHRDLLICLIGHRDQPLLLFFFIGHREHLTGYAGQFGNHILGGGVLLLQGSRIGRKNIGHIISGTALGVVDQGLHREVVVITTVSDDLLDSGKGSLIAGINDCRYILRQLCVGDLYGRAGIRRHSP